MQLTLHSDYALRVLIHLAVHADRRVTAEEIARAYGISRAHLTKVIQRLAHAGYVETVRGRTGGLRLARAPEAITLGEVVRVTETLELVDCFRPDEGCVIAPACGLRGALHEALGAFLAVLDERTLADAARRRSALRQELAKGAPRSRAGRGAASAGRPAAAAGSRAAGAARAATPATRATRSPRSGGAASARSGGAKAKAGARRGARRGDARDPDPRSGKGRAADTPRGRGSGRGRKRP